MPFCCCLICPCRWLWCAGEAAWDYDVEAQAIQARLLDLNSIMPGALKELDSSRLAAAAIRQVRLSLSHKSSFVPGGKMANSFPDAAWAAQMNSPTQPLDPTSESISQIRTDVQSICVQHWFAHVATVLVTQVQPAKYSSLLA